MFSFSFKNVVFYIQVLINLICVRNFTTVMKIVVRVARYRYKKFEGFQEFSKSLGVPAFLSIFLDLVTVKEMSLKKVIDGNFLSDLVIYITRRLFSSFH